MTIEEIRKNAPNGATCEAGIMKWDAIGFYLFMITMSICYTYAKMNGVNLFD